MTFKSIPLTVREIKATEATLERIYAAAYDGLKGDSLALAAGLLPAEYNRLVQFDPVAELAEKKGRADAERDMARVLVGAAKNGDHKAALEVLKHSHSWVAKQAVSVEIDQKISITQALAQAEERLTLDMDTHANAYIQPRRRANADGPAVVVQDQG